MSDSDYKQAHFKNLLDCRQTVLVSFRTGDPAKVPAMLSGNPALQFEYGLDMRRPMLDLRVDDAGIFARLDFSGTVLPTFVPWTHVFLLEYTPRAPANKIYAWPLDAPGRSLESLTYLPIANRTGSGEYKLDLKERMVRSGLRLIRGDKT